MDGNNLKKGWHQFLTEDQLWQVRALKNKFLFLKEDRRKKDYHYFSTRGFYWYRCVFIHIPKTAGVSVAASLFNSLGAGHATLRDYEKIFGQRLKHFFTFSIVRNPWDRLYSAYSFLKNGGFNALDQRWSQQNLDSINSFREFIMEWLNEESMYEKIHFYPQTHFLLNEENEIQLDFIARYENLDEDFQTICNKLKIKRHLLKVNTSARQQNYRSIYSKSMEAKVRSLYQEDIQKLQYVY